MNPPHSLARLGLALLLTAAAVPAHAAGLRISEALYDAVGSDQGQVFVELHGTPGHVLDGHRLEGVNGAGGAIGPVLALTGVVPADGFFVVADEDAGSTLVPEADLLLDFDFQNGPDSIVLRDPADAILDALGYGMFGPGDVFAGEGGSAPDPAAGQSVARLFANVDTDDNAADFAALDTPTPGFGPIALPEPEPAALLAVSVLCLAAARGRRSP